MKGAIQSKTIWFGTIITMLGVWDQIAPFIPAEWKDSKAFVIIGAIVVFLRTITTTSLAEKGAPE